MGCMYIPFILRYFVLQTLSVMFDLSVFELTPDYIPFNLRCFVLQALSVMFDLSVFELTPDDIPFHLRYFVTTGTLRDV